MGGRLLCSVVTGGLLLAGSAYGQVPAAKRVATTVPLSADRTSRAGEALTRGAPNQALEFADEAIKADGRNAWAHYDRGSALAELRKVDDAVASFRDAERLFAGADGWGHSVAVWGRAHVLYQAGRCAEAREAFQDYVRTFQSLDPDGAALAQRRAESCKAPDPSATP